MDGKLPIVAIGASAGGLEAFTELVQELTTLNAELENRNAEMSQTLSDLNNLLTGVDIPILMLDKNLQVRTVTRVAERVLGLIPAEVGSPIRNLKLEVTVAHRDQHLSEVFELDHEFPRVARKRMLLNARRIDQAGQRPALILLAMEVVAGPTRD